MTMPSDDVDFPETLSFQADEGTRRKKGAHRPHFATVFTKKATIAKTPKRVHLLVNPFAGKKKVEFEQVKLENFSKKQASW